MERLTDKIYEKTNDVSNLMQNVSTKYGYIEYLSADLGTVKDRLEAVVDEVWEYIEKLNEYEDLEEQRKLLKLPCAVGDTVYRICPKCNDAHNGSCKNCAWENSCSNRGCTVYGGWKDGQYPMGECTIVPYKVSWNYIPNLLENIGKRVFLTREEAEVALKRMEG